MSKLVGRGHRAGGLLGGRGQGGRGKGKEAIISETCGHLGGQEENGESPEVQSGLALPMGRCASPPQSHPKYLHNPNTETETPNNSMYIYT